MVEYDGIMAVMPFRLLILRSTNCSKKLITWHHQHSQDCNQVTPRSAIRVAAFEHCDRLIWFSAATARSFVSIHPYYQDRHRGHRHTGTPNTDSVHGGGEFTRKGKWASTVRPFAHGLNNEGNLHMAYIFIHTE